MTYRRARPEDAERTYDVVREAADDLLRRAGQTPSEQQSLPHERVIRFRHACIAHDPDRFWVAESDTEIIGAAIAVLRGDVWYLGALHVVPGHQGTGVGSELLRRSLTGTRPDTARTVLTDALNPVSNALYLRSGMLPQETTLTFDGPIGGPRSGEDADDGNAGDTPPLPFRPIEPAADGPLLADLDRAGVGFARPMDHAFWTGVPGVSGWILTAATGARGYLYVSDTGAIGPGMVRDPDDLPRVLDVAAAMVQGQGARGLHLRVFGSTHGAIRWALGRGLRLSGIGLMLSSRPVGRFEGYLTSGADALY